MKPYLLIIWNDINPEVIGPFADDQERDKRAKGIRATDPDKEHGIYKLWADGTVHVSAFRGTEDLDELLNERGQ